MNNNKQVRRRKKLVFFFFVCFSVTGNDLGLILEQASQSWHAWVMSDSCMGSPHALAAAHIVFFPASDVTSG